MLQPLSDPEKEFLQKHLTDEPAKLMLQAKKYPNLPVSKLVQQIQARQKAKHKLPQWYKNLDLIFPANLSVEQSSSEQTAAFKATLVQGKTLIDLTGGFGIDSSFFSQHFEQVFYVEQQPELTGIAAYNFKQLNLNNIRCHNTTAEAFLKSFPEKADVIYLDPARRDEQQQKVHQLSDCTPDVTTLLPVLLSKSESVLIKTSPMLDIDLALTQLRQVQQVWIISADNECKEVLYLIDEKSAGPPLITAVELNREQPAFTFTRLQEENTAVAYAAPKKFIYEPNVALLKAGAFKTIASEYHLFKLHPNSHLYTSDTFAADFPGRIFSCRQIARYNRKEVKELVPEGKANITTRNFPDSVADIRKKTGLKEGGNTYIFATTDLHNKHILLICEKINNSQS